MANIKIEIPDEFEKIAPNLSKSLTKEMERLSKLPAEKHPDLMPKSFAQVLDERTIDPPEEVSADEFKTPPQPPLHSFSNIRKREDGSFVVSLMTEIGSLEYHVTHSDIDPFVKPGLMDAVLEAIKEGATVTTWENPTAPEPSDDEKLSWAKGEAKHVIELLQYEFDVADTGVRKNLSGPLQEWKRYRLDLEKLGLHASKPEKPQWING